VQLLCGLTQVGPVPWMSSQLAVVEVSEGLKLPPVPCVDPRDPLTTDLPHLELQ
jgi:hypothetical protein